MVRGIITYDITEARFRAKLSKLLKGYCQRVQFSVFEFELQDNLYEELMKKLKSIYEEYLTFAYIKGDFEESKRSIRIYFLCRNCNSKMVVLDKKQKLKDKGMII